MTLVPISEMLTTQQARDMLNVSRPYLASLIDRGEVEHHMVGGQRRIKAEHLFADKKRRDAQRAAALAELAAVEEDLL